MLTLKVRNEEQSQIKYEANDTFERVKKLK